MLLQQQPRPRAILVQFKTIAAARNQKMDIPRSSIDPFPVMVSMRFSMTVYESMELRGIREHRKERDPQRKKRNHKDRMKERTKNREERCPDSAGCGRRTSWKQQERLEKAAGKGAA